MEIHVEFMQIKLTKCNVINAKDHIVESTYTSQVYRNKRQKDCLSKQKTHYR